VAGTNLTNELRGGTLSGAVEASGHGGGGGEGKSKRSKGTYDHEHAPSDVDLTRYRRRNNDKIKISTTNTRDSDQYALVCSSSHAHNLSPTCGSSAAAFGLPSRAQGMKNFPFASAAVGAVAQYSCVSAPYDTE
jgi:hypothetical protein